MPTRVDFSKFECHRCGNCCTGDGDVTLTRPDIHRISDFLKMSEFDFLQTYTRKADGRSILIDQPGPEMACIFLIREGEGGCRIHPVKPKQCVDFPRKWREEESWQTCAGLRALLKSTPTARSSCLPTSNILSKQATSSAKGQSRG